MVTKEELEEIKDSDTFKCEDCQKYWHGWAIRDNYGNCPNCQRHLL